MSTNWIVTANSNLARIFIYREKDGTLREAETLLNPTARLPESQLGTSKPGVRSGNGHQHHGTKSGESIKHNEAEKFAVQINSRLLEGSNQNQYEQLALIAEPQFLGLLRKHLSSSVTEQVAFEIDKDYTHLSNSKALRAKLPKSFLYSLA